MRWPAPPPIPATHQYPSNRGRPELREAFARFYARRFGVELDPDTQIVPALGAKEAVFNLNLAFLDAGQRRAGGGPGLSRSTRADRCSRAARRC